MKKKNIHDNVLKICHFGHKRIPSREGGVEIVVEELAKRQVALGHKVTCYNRSGHHVSGRQFDGKKLKEYKGIRLKQVFTVDRKGLAAVTSSFFASIEAAVGNYDVVHIHAEGPAAFCWIPKLFGKRVIVHIHGLDHLRTGKFRGFGCKYIKFGEKCAVKFADQIIVLSESVWKYFMDAYGRKTVFIPNGVNRPVIREAGKIKSRWSLEKNSYILFLGRLVPEKGLQYLVNAHRRLNTDKKLVIAGGSSDTDEFVAELKNNCESIEKRVVFTGFVQGEVLDELYSNAYIYVLPSDLEGMPLSLLEAMSYGNCCVVSNIDECVSVVKDKLPVEGKTVSKNEKSDKMTDTYRAVIFKKGNVDDLQEKLQMLCDDEKLVQKYKAGAADYICGKYRWDDVVQKVMELYRGIGNKDGQDGYCSRKEAVQCRKAL